MERGRGEISAPTLKLTEGKTNKNRTSVLNEAATNEEDATIAVFALMECMQSMITSTLLKKDDAIAEFEALTQAYVNDWKQHGH